MSRFYQINSHQFIIRNRNPKKNGIKNVGSVKKFQFVQPNSQRKNIKCESMLFGHMCHSHFQWKLIWKQIHVKKNFFVFVFSKLASTFESEKKSPFQNFYDLCLSLNCNSPERHKNFLENFQTILYTEHWTDAFRWECKLFEEKKPCNWISFSMKIGLLVCLIKSRHTLFLSFTFFSSAVSDVNEKKRRPNAFKPNDLWQ